MTRMRRAVVVACVLAVAGVSAQPRLQPNWTAVDAEALKHFQALLRIDTSDPPGREREAVDYLKQVLAAEGIDAQEF
jgi:hypothetical protein